MSLINENIFTTNTVIVYKEILVVLTQLQELTGIDLTYSKMKNTNMVQEPIRRSLPSFTLRLETSLPR